MFELAKPKITMNTEGIVKASEIVISLLPYRDEFILTNQIKHAAADNMHGKKFKELGHDFGKWDGKDLNTSDGWITSQLINANVIKHTRTVYNERTFDNDEYYVLTKMGRKMKGEEGLRTLEQLREWKTKRREKNRKKKELEVKLLESQVMTNEISKTANILISIFTGAAAMWYLRDVAKSILLDYFPKDYHNPTQLNGKGSNLLNAITASVLVTGIIAILRIIRLHRRSPNSIHST
jgi:hypothetical protein